MLGDTGINHPDNWEDNITSEDLHAVVILFARDREERERCIKTHQEYLDQSPGVEILSTLLLEAVPPFDYVHEHFGYRDRITTPVIEGMGIESDTQVPHPPSTSPGEFFLGYPDETGLIPDAATTGDPFKEWKLSGLQENAGTCGSIPRFSESKMEKHMKNRNWSLPK